MATVSDPDGPYAARLVDVDEQGAVPLYRFRAEDSGTETPAEFTTTLPRDSDLLRAVLDYNDLVDERDLRDGGPVEVLVVCESDQWHLVPEAMRRRA